MLLTALQHPLIPAVPAQPRLALSATFLVVAVLVQLGMLLSVGSLRARLWDRIRSAPQLLTAPEQTADALVRPGQLATSDGGWKASDPAQFAEFANQLADDTTDEVDAAPEETYDREITRVDLSIFR
jgi:hypothetical protein